jgi:hypothetical protein
MLVHAARRESLTDHKQYEGQGRLIPEPNISGPWAKSIAPTTQPKWHRRQRCYAGEGRDPPGFPCHGGGQVRQDELLCYRVMNPPKPPA